MELNGGPAITKLKEEPCPSRLIEGVEMQRCRMGWSYTRVWLIKIRIVGARDPSPTLGPQAQGSSARKIKSP